MQNYNTLPVTDKKISPYGGVLRSALNHPETWPRYAGTSPDGLGVSIILIVGSEAWEKAKKLLGKHLFLILPQGYDPKKYDWSLLKDHDPILVLVAGKDLTAKEYRRLALALMRDGVTRLLRPNGDGTAVRYLSERVIKCPAH